MGGIALLDAGPLDFLPTLIGDVLVPEVADTYNASILVLLAFIGGFVKLVEWSGGGAAFARAVARGVNTRLRAQLGAWASGIIIFFSDLGTPLIVGPVFHPLMDRLTVSRQKLAFILDSTSSPVAILIPFIGWGVFIMSVMADAFTANGVEQNEWDAFVSAIPFQLYAWLAIAVVPFLAAAGVDFGPMRRAEASASAQRAATSTADAQAHGHTVVVWLPLLVLGVTLFLTLRSYGFPQAQVPGSAFRAALAAAYLLASVTLVSLLVSLRLRPLLGTFTAYAQGMSGMMTIAATLVLAWALSSVSEQLGTGPFVGELARQGVTGALLPVITFVVAAAISFAVGSSWGTIVIMMPLAVPAALATDAALAVTVGAVLSGGLFGDHASPVSETTLLSSTGAGTTPLAHFATQLPYAVGNGLLAAMGYVLAGTLASPWIAAGLVVIQGILILFLARVTARARDATN